MADKERPSALDVAAAILERTGPTDTFRIQKLAYYSQAWHLVWAGAPLFEERIEAWANGPVIPALYRQHRGEFTLREIPGGSASRLGQEEAATVASVVDAYGRLGGRQLALLTHQEAPWREAREGLGPGERGNREITLDSMAAFYSALDSDPEAPYVDQLLVELGVV